MCQECKTAKRSDGIAILIIAAVILAAYIALSLLVHSLKNNSVYQAGVLLPIILFGTAFSMCYDILFGKKES